MPPSTRTSTSAAHRPSRSPPPPPISRRQTTLSVTAAPLPPTALLIPVTQTPVLRPAQALGIPLRFHVVQDSLHVQGYQLYAVEKWIVERNRPITTLVVYTGDLSHKIPVTVLRPSPDLSPSEAQAEWDKALIHLRRDGARPKETPHGILMATSLAHFRSDYTIVHIPEGDFLAVREHLYANINLLRMGCAGRSALTLEEPSNTTKDRFISTYHLPESVIPADNASTDHLQLPMALTKTRPCSHSRSTSVLSFSSPTKRDTLDSSPMSKAKVPVGLGHPIPQQAESRSPSRSTTIAKTRKDHPTFIATVLELVKLVQAGLVISGMYKPSSGTVILPYLDGLLCDETVEGIRKWITEVGDPCVGLEPMERIADPTFVAALFSVILTTRNKIAALGFSHVVPKDPFLQPQNFTSALTSYINNTTSVPSPSSSPALPHQDRILPILHLPGSTTSSTAAIPFHAVHGRGRAVFYLPPHLHNSPQVSPSSSGGSSFANASSSTSTSPSPVFLTREVVEAVGAAYDAKVRPADGRVGGRGGRMRRALRGGLRAGVESDGDVGEWERGATSGGEGDRADRGGLGIVGAARDGEREKESLAGVTTVVSSSGGQILSGIGSLASGLRLGGVGDWSGSGASTGPASVFEGTYDMAWFSRVVSGKDRRGKRRIAGMGRKKIGEGDMLGVGYAYAYRGKEKEKDAAIGMSVRALWSGGICTLVKLREWEIEQEKMGAGVVADKKVMRVSGRQKGRDRLALSDGDVEDPVALPRSETEEETDNVGAGGFGGMWSERMQRKIESWTGIAKRRGHMSLDLSVPSLRTSAKDVGTKASRFNDPIVRSKLNNGDGTPVSPTLPPTIFIGSADADADDDDFLSSGQVSPIDNSRHAPFHVLQDGRSVESTSLTNTSNAEYERKISEFNQKRPWGGRLYPSRISSWADPVSALDVFDGNKYSGERKEKKTPGSFLGQPEEMEEDGELGEWSEGEGMYEPLGRRLAWACARRRRSFHDLDSWKDIGVLPPDRMRVDVELCGQLLIMHRRERHLQNVVACLHVLTNKLTQTNTLFREDNQSHIPLLSELDDSVQVISAIDTESAKADKTSQATHSLRYESEQFRVPDLWHTATPPRRKVLELREKVFGTGGRRLAPGVHGAHGRFNRLQQTLDGQKRLVDYMGRTESEAEEEEVGADFMGPSEEEDEDDVVRHHAIKPMWLLHFFTSWGAKWGATSTEEQTANDTKGGSSKDIANGTKQSLKEKEA